MRVSPTMSGKNCDRRPSSFNPVLPPTHSSVALMPSRLHDGRQQLTNSFSSSDPEPRRSVRATKGQHKALELDQTPEAPKRRGGKKGKKAAAQEEPEEEVIRCVCGATEQDDHSDEAWIACDKCGVWQHNTCMGMSQFEEDLARDYFCELCRPENHKELLESIARGERLWEVRRKQYEEEEAESKKKKKGGKKGKGKRTSDPKEELGKKAKASPAPSTTPTPAAEPQPPKKEAKSSSAKRKASDTPQEKDAKVRSKAPRLYGRPTNPDPPLEQPSQKLRKVSETEAVPVPAYSAPDDLPSKITELPEGRQGATKLLAKSFTHSIGVAEKNGRHASADGASVPDQAERLALQVERAVHDTHANQTAYNSQMRTLVHNIKTNQDLCDRLLSGALIPPMIATMSTEELASNELKKETAEMKARAEKQAIKITEDGPPRMRKTHKGDEVIGEDNLLPSDEIPGPSIRRKSHAEPKQPAAAADSGSKPSPAESGQQQKGLHVDIKQSPTAQDFDINKVFSSVKSPTVSHNRRPSAPVPPPADGPGIDPEVDRLLDDSNSPPYSPSEESDPDVVWRGLLVMNTIANIPMTAKHVAGCNLQKSINLPWNKVIPRTLRIAGRIDEEKAITYLCSLRFSDPTDIVVAALTPTSDSSREEVQALVNYFVPKKKYGVIGDKSHNNVRDTYLVPVLPGEGNHPEFLLNLEDNVLPSTRTEPVLLLVIVYRNDAATMDRIRGRAPSNPAIAPMGVATPTPPAGGYQNGQRVSISGPAFSPTSPQGAFPTNYPTPQHPAPQGVQSTPTPSAHNGQPNIQTAQFQGEALAREVLGPYFASPTARFIMPQAHKMVRREWEVIYNIYARDPRAREDLQHLSKVLESVSHEPAPSTTAAPASASPPQAPLAPHPAPATQSHIPPPPVPPSAVHPQTHVPPPVVRNTPIPPPTIPQSAVPASAHPAPAGPPRQTPIPPPTIPPKATAGASGSSA